MAQLICFTMGSPLKYLWELSLSLPEPYSFHEKIEYEILRSVAIQNCYSDLLDQLTGKTV